jgi:hypothetical protein
LTLFSVIANFAMFMTKREAATNIHGAMSFETLRFMIQFMQFNPFFSFSTGYVIDVESGTNHMNRQQAVEQFRIFPDV